MRISNITVSTGDGRSRVSALISSSVSNAEQAWFDVPAEHAGMLSTRGDAWLAAYLAAAATLGEPLAIDGAVDPQLLQQAQTIQATWKSWYPHLHQVPVSATQVSTAQSQRSTEAVGAFLSGGVDSVFTALSRCAEGRGDPATTLDYLLVVDGFDHNLYAADKFRQLREHSLAPLAAQIGVPLFDVATNVRSTCLRVTDWSYLTHGSLLAAVSLVLQNGLATTLIASSYRGDNPSPWGSHPRIDPLFSTRNMTIVHHGSALRRTDKTAFLAQIPGVFNNLAICYRDKVRGNCGKCEKCIRTMTTLHILGRLEGCNAFPSNEVDLSRIENIVTKRHYSRVFWTEILELARERGHGDIVKAIERNFRWQTYLDPLLQSRIALLRKAGKLTRSIVMPFVSRVLPRRATKQAA